MDREKDFRLCGPRTVLGIPGGDEKHVLQKGARHVRLDTDLYLTAPGVKLVPDKQCDLVGHVVGSRA